MNLLCFILGHRFVDQRCQCRSQRAHQCDRGRKVCRRCLLVVSA